MNAHHNRTTHHQFLPELRKSRAALMRTTPWRKEATWGKPCSCAQGPVGSGGPTLGSDGDVGASLNNTSYQGTKCMCRLYNVSAACGPIQEMDSPDRNRL